ncbi:three-Cys-motif partner protein TcmP [Mucilaginibacter sp.]|uniref:three-Cys-motif partner protein TcmP n=1 Tax=Mucilaginibacter sp. TaxID=1882438 RepID=UPI002ED566BE
MTKKIDSQKVMLDHSEAKVKLLGKYLDRYLNIIANDGYTKKINIFDLFCGEGLYENGGKGSPIIILENVKKLHSINSGRIDKIPSIDIFFNDIKKEKTDKVDSIVKQKGLHSERFGQLYYRNKNYKEIIPSLSAFLDKSKDAKSFIFIDPYGYKEIRASEIKGLLKSKKSEVLLFLPTQFMYRFDEKGTPESLIELLDDLVEYNKWKSNESVFHFIDQFKEAFKQNLGSEFFVDTFTIQKDKHTVFCLFFFSSHIRGFEKMLEAKWDIDTEAGKGWKYERTRSLFEPFKTNLLESNLLKKLANSAMNNVEIYNFTLHSGFLPKHMNEVLNTLQETNKISVTLKTGEKARKNAFYVNYDHYKNNEDKVLIKLC